MCGGGRHVACIHMLFIVWLNVFIMEGMLGTLKLVTREKRREERDGERDFQLLSLYSVIGTEKKYKYNA